MCRPTCRLCRCPAPECQAKPDPSIRNAAARGPWARWRGRWLRAEARGLSQAERGGLTPPPGRLFGAMRINRPRRRRAVGRPHDVGSVSACRLPGCGEPAGITSPLRSGGRRLPSSWRPEEIRAALRPASTRRGKRSAPRPRGGKQYCPRAFQRRLLAQRSQASLRRPRSFPTL